MNCRDADLPSCLLLKQFCWVIFLFFLLVMDESPATLVLSHHCLNYLQTKLVLKICLNIFPKEKVAISNKSQDIICPCWEVSVVLVKKETNRHTFLKVGSCFCQKEISACVRFQFKVCLE